MRKIEFQSLQENYLIREIKLLTFLKTEFFRIKTIFKTKEEESEKESEEESDEESEKERFKKFNKYMNHRVLTMICLKIILILWYLVLWQKHYMRQKIKIKNNELVELIKVRWSNLKYKIEKMSEDEKEINQIKY